MPCHVVNCARVKLKSILISNISSDMKCVTLYCETCIRNEIMEYGLQGFGCNSLIIQGAMFYVVCKCCEMTMLSAIMGYVYVVCFLLNNRILTKRNKSNCPLCEINSNTVQVCMSRSSSMYNWKVDKCSNINHTCFDKYLNNIFHVDIMYCLKVVRGISYLVNIKFIKTIFIYFMFRT